MLHDVYFCYISHQLLLNDFYFTSLLITMVCTVFLYQRSCDQFVIKLAVIIDYINA